MTATQRSVDATRRRMLAVVGKCWDAVSVHTTDGCVKFANGAVGRLVGCAADDLVGTDPWDFVHADDRSLVVDAFRSALEREVGGDVIQYRIRRIDGEIRTVESIVSNLVDEPEVEGVLVTTRDVTARLLAEDRLERLALHDPATGLPNRTSFCALLTRSLATRTTELAVLHIEVDGFDWMIDSFGHAFGDEVLRAIGVRLRSIAEGLTAHLGNGAFAVVLEVAEKSSTLDRMRALVVEMQRPLRVAGQVVEPTASIGVAFADDEAGDAGNLTRWASCAAHLARERGGARVAIYEGELVRAVERKLQLVRDLRVAVATKDFRVEYQPIVGLADQHVYGVEALLRWGTAPSPTAYPPSEFIPIAEENGLIVPLGRWVINRAIESRVACRGSSRLMLNINLSARQLSEPDIVESIDETLRRTGMSASRVGFEITETLAVHDIERAARVVSDIRALGCRVGIDDFGTGYSSLARLQELKVDFIKIDQSFVSGLGRDRAAEALVAATLALARELRLEVVAEGVETKAQAQRLEALGCTFAQGYFLGRPRASLATLLRRNVTRHHGLVTVHHE